MKPTTLMVSAEKKRTKSLGTASNGAQKPPLVSFGLGDSRILGICGPGRSEGVPVVATGTAVIGVWPKPHVGQTRHAQMVRAANRVNVNTAAIQTPIQGLNNEIGQEP
jgi:hypothetical protein